MKIRLYLCVFLSVLLLSGCVVIGLRQHYSFLSKEERGLVVWTNLEDSLKNIKNDERIYAITGGQMHEMIKDCERAMIYCWSPHCTSEHCVSLDYLQRNCNEKSVELFVIVDYFDDAFCQISSLTDHPLFIINSKYYGSEYCKRLERLFFVDLLGENEYKNQEENFWYRYIYFENGNFVTLMQDPSELNYKL